MAITLRAFSPLFPMAPVRLTAAMLAIVTMVALLMFLDQPQKAADDHVVIDGDRQSTTPIVIRARTITVRGTLTAPLIELHAEALLVVEPTARLLAVTGTNGGRIDLDAPRVVLGGAITADGNLGGMVTVASDRLLLHGRISADGAERPGEVRISWNHNCQQIQAGVISASGPTGGRVDLLGCDGRAYLSGSVQVRGSQGDGGRIDLTGDDLCLIGARLDASGAKAGGRVRIGGPAHGRGPELRHARSTRISATASVCVDAQRQGRGGDIVVWSDERTDMQGDLSARGGMAAGDGGSIEVSSRGQCGAGGTTDAGAAHGRAGTVLLDPKDIIISTVTGIYPQYELIDPHPGVGSNEFGRSVLPLATGNVVVRSPGDNLGFTAYAGAVYLFNAHTGVLIASLNGVQSYDGNNAFVTALTNGSYVVHSPDCDNGAVDRAGAVTWGSGTAGVSGVISAANSLVGSTTADQVGSLAVTELSNGNYVVRSPGWNNGAVVDAGAVTWCSGIAGISGAISAANSLVGSTAGDVVGDYPITALANGNYVVRSPTWDAGAVANAGAATWGAGTSGARGVVSASNSLIGSTVGDLIGSAVTELASGHYVTFSSEWDNGAAVNAGAATWGNGTSGVRGTVSSANSLVGSQTDDLVGMGGVTALSTGHYVVKSPRWDNAGAANAGAATWGNGNSGVRGAVTTLNSLVGTTAEDLLGWHGFGATGVVEVAGGNYVVVSPSWNNGVSSTAGAVTWRSGAGGANGPVTTLNSLVGSSTGDAIGYAGVAVLGSGHYVVCSPMWQSATGAATWGSGTAGVQGAVSAVNSLVGAQLNDNVASHGVTVLGTGHYVINSPLWDNGGTANVGAVTWSNGATVVTGVVSAANSLIGTTAEDQIGQSGVTALGTGHYVVCSPFWDNSSAIDAGAVTWCNGASGRTGAVSAANSLVGSTTDDRLGFSVYPTSSGGVITAESNVIRLANGNYVVGSHLWSNGASLRAGAATWCSGASGRTGAVSAANSLVGSTIDDRVGGNITALSTGHYVVLSPSWDNGAVAGAGAATWGNGASGVVGIISTANSLVGTRLGDTVGYGMTALQQGHYLINSTYWDSGTVVDSGAVTWMDGATGKTIDGQGTISAVNSVLGEVVGSVFSNLMQPVQASGAGLIIIPEHKSNQAGRVRVIYPDADPNRLVFSSALAQTLRIQPGYLTRTLNTGTAVVLQASNDITVSSAITSNNPSGAGGALTLQAGRTLAINASITTDGGNLTLIANDDLASGVIDAQRASGLAQIAIGAGAIINAGTGDVSVELRAGTGKTQSASGDILMQQGLSAQSVTVTNRGLSANSGIVQNGTWTVGGAMSFSATTGNVLLMGSLPITAAGIVSGDVTTNISGVIAAVAGQGTIAVTGQLILTSASLNLTAGGTPAVGSAHTLITNDGSDAVTGTFNGKAEGALVTVGAQTWRISYVGGDGNDVIMIRGGTPVITWAIPSSVNVGTALSAAQLNATAPVPGTFTYTPTLGTVPPLGANSLGVVFQPTDTALYTSASATVTLTVNPLGTPVITSALTASGTIGADFQYPISASNGPTSHSATPLPAGLIFNTANGRITGTPTTAGSTSVALGATNGSGTGTATVVIAIAAPTGGGGGTPPTAASGGCGLGSGIGALISALALAVLLAFRRR